MLSLKFKRWKECQKYVEISYLLLLQEQSLGHWV